MPIFEPIKDAILYTWHTNSTLRFCCKLVTCPLFGLCYWIRYIGPITFHKCPGPPAPPRRQHALANIEYRRRVRRLKKRKRSVSVDRTRGLWRKNAEDQSQSPFLAKLPATMIATNIGTVGIKAASGCNTKMLRTCKKMYREAIPLLYSQNTFKFEGYKVLSIFTSTILPQRLASIRNIVIDDTHDLLASLGGIADLGEVVLRYRLRENKYRLIPRLHEFALLEKWEKEERPRGYEMFYEMLDVHPGPKIDGMLFDRWVIGERKSICRVDSNEDVE
ncbi:hypothetical protein BKA58DRAFT_395415 [Alternaria rosae]|uniref:uncharacterized protein n=1 Tax=Alternaria rosae TaxID=1187941 RepID=UPI001E8E8129|nr:uncharacterized protein BKA58DRAFT_395415 [Alternaria rosae]KAH6845924.1 hypothetical protein BKA58DRAFT_395415 [Alternaria rosae]